MCNVDPTDTDAIARLLDSTDPARISTDTGVRVNVTKDQFGTWGLTANALIPALGEIKSRELWKALKSDTDDALSSSLKKGHCKLTYTKTLIWHGYTLRSFQPPGDAGDV